MSKTIENILFKCLIILSIFITLQSCNERKNINLNKAEKVDSTKTIEYKLKNEPKIFLKYWSGMTVAEAFKVHDILIKEGIIKFESGVFTYLLDEYSTVIEFNYNVADKLESITLESNIDIIYPLYQKKYNLPDLINQNLLYQCYLDNNKDYDPVLTYKKIGQGDKPYQVPDILFDKTPPVKGRIYFDINDEKYNANYIEKKFYKDEFAVDKDSVFIVFKQSFKDESFPFTSYSLYKNTEAMSAQQNINGDGFGTINNQGTGITEDIIMKNSRTVTVYKSHVLEKSITYLSKKEYYKRKKLIDDKLKKDSLESKTERDKLKSRKEKSIHEI